MPVHTAAPAGEDELALVHDREYLGRVRERCRETRVLGYLDPDTYITPASFAIAAGAAGAAVEAARRALGGEHSFALVRPPGHHAERGRAMGFCIFNNVAIAAAVALKSAGRVAVIDWDYHHGNGTQHAFYESDRVLYCSVHHGGAFPYSGAAGETGAGAGSGFTINAPLDAGAQAADYRLIFEQVFSPAIRRFDPDLTIVSAGQDILSDDPLGMMQLHPPDIGMMAGLIMDASPVPLSLVLEGGYGQSHGLAVSHIFRALTSRAGRALIPVPAVPAMPQTMALAASLRSIHRL